MRRPLATTTGFAVVIPVHDEASLLPSALRALDVALAEVQRYDVVGFVALVLDSCSDQSGMIATTWAQSHVDDSHCHVSVVTCDAHNVGVARGVGCDAALHFFDDQDLTNVWIATTDADSQVSRRWLREQVKQHRRGVGVWAGRVALDDSSIQRDSALARWQRDYDCERGPIHGASLGFEAAHYVSAGGFAPVRTGEDRALHAALVEVGARPHYDTSTRVLTSARRFARAPHGFADVLNRYRPSLRPVTD